ncbi:uncharacterized protein LOC132557020 [Ylistrum balloti]|uniref:uncharacterized protein LOC132557020 n=1 Tax=Ylistrum balloti TaxID=509963 RepID=UPI002905C068|nr:uncharacterized protein LOC132557020 [Ylistrum balloti]
MIIIAMMGRFTLKGLLISVLLTNLLSPVLCGASLVTHIEPSDTVYMAVGERLDVVCSYKGDNSSDNLTIQRCKNQNCSAIPAKPVNTSSIWASVQRLNKEENLTFTCCFQHNPKTMSMLYVRVGYRPSPPDDIYCFSRNHQSMNCTVTLAERDVRSGLSHNVTIHFSSTRSTEWRKCPDYNPQYYSCYWRPPSDNETNIDDNFIINRYYRIRANVTNVLGNNHLIRKINDTSNIVVISELRQFKATDVTYRKAILTWMLPKSLQPVTFIINFAINYTSKWDKKQLVYSNRTVMRTELKNLTPYTKYDVSIRARSEEVTNLRNWSPAYRISFRTKADAPSAAPKSTEGGFFLSRINNKTGLQCALHIYLKPLLPKDRNCAASDMRYKVFLKDENNPSIIGAAETIRLSHGTCWSKGPYDVVVQSCYKNFTCSKKRTFVHIPDFDQKDVTVFPSASDVIAEGFGGTSFRVSWSIPSYVNESLVKRVTVFWCRRSKEQHICKRNLSWQKIEKLVTSADIMVNHSNYREWMFAVSLITHSGESSGMVFDDCQFLYDKSLSQKTDKAVKPTFNLVTREGLEGQKLDIVSLTFRYCDTQFLSRKPDYYEVFYKVAQRNTEDCIYGSQLLNVSATLRVQEILLPDLDPMSHYSVCMRIRTSVGTSEVSDVEWRKPIIFDDGSDSSFILIGVFTALVCLTVAIAVIWYCWRKYKAIDTHIDIPSIDKVTEERTKLRTESFADSGIYSTGEITITREGEKGQSSKQPARLEYMRSNDNETKLGDQESTAMVKADSDQTTTSDQAGIPCSMLKNLDKKRGSDLSDYCRTDNKTNDTTSSYSSLCVSGNQDDGYVDDGAVWDKIADDIGSTRIPDNDNSGHIKVMDSDDFSLTPLLIDNDSGVIKTYSGHNYRPQLDKGITPLLLDSDYSTSDSNGFLQEVNVPLWEGGCDDPLERSSQSSYDVTNRYSLIFSNGDNQNERHLLRVPNKSYTMSLEISCLDGSSRNPCLVDESEDGHSLVYKYGDVGTDTTCSKPPNEAISPLCEHYLDIPVTESDSRIYKPVIENSNSDKFQPTTTCQQRWGHSGTFDQHQDDDGACCDQREHNSSTCSDECKNFSTCHDTDKDTSGSCRDPHKGHSITRHGPEKDTSGSCRDPLKGHSITRHGPEKDTSGSCRDPHKGHSITRHGPEKDTSGLCHEPLKDYSGTRYGPDKDNSGSCRGSHKDHSGSRRNFNEERERCVTSNSDKRFESNKKIQGETESESERTIKRGQYVARIC